MQPEADGIVPTERRIRFTTNEWPIYLIQFEMSPGSFLNIELTPVMTGRPIAQVIFTLFIHI